ncbi:MAG: Peptidoglycan-associated lipoprotein [Syntrophus sp. SKADARSKE-3]|nr:Peptidoglycan-associated lipoprotein [Syntrophus sp. SKADARSKE-3]
MRKSLPLFAVVIFACLAISGCYTKGEYMQKSAEADAKTQELAALQQKYTELTAEKAKLTNQRDELDKLLKVESNAMSRDIMDLRKKNAELQKEVEALRVKEVIIQKESNTYQNLVKEMKGEIANGQITITELKGKLTLDVVDKILFASGDATVKKEGLDVLKRVTDILKTVKDKAIRIEGHTDNKPIHTAKFPSNWELSAARAINVTKYLQQQNVDPAILSAVAYGEFKPVADNATVEGRAKNRRIAIVLVPKD